jgi:hypothetical protein
MHQNSLRPDLRWQQYDQHGLTSLNALTLKDLGTGTASGVQQDHVRRMYQIGATEKLKRKRIGGW